MQTDFQGNCIQSKAIIQLRKEYAAKSDSGNMSEGFILWHLGGIYLLTGIGGVILCFD